MTLNGNSPKKNGTVQEQAIEKQNQRREYIFTPQENLGGEKRKRENHRRYQSALIFPGEPPERKAGKKEREGNMRVWLV